VTLFGVLAAILVAAVLTLLAGIGLVLWAWRR